MRHSRTVATWLLEQSRIDIGLTGDLLEEQANGRPTIWYWRQVMVAVAVSIWGDIRAHKVVMLGAVMTGIGAETVLWGLYNAFVSSWLPLGPMTSLVPWTINLLIIFVTQIATGWLIARTHRKHPMPALLAFLTFSLTWWAYQNFSLIRGLAVDSIDQPRFRIYLFYHLSNLFVITLSLFLGALLSGSRKSPTVDDRAEE